MQLCDEIWDDDANIGGILIDESIHKDAFSVLWKNGVVGTIPIPLPSSENIFSTGRNFQDSLDSLLDGICDRPPGVAK